MKRHTLVVAFAMALLMLIPASLFASSHREAPIAALDHSADVTDWYAFVSYDHPDRVTTLYNVLNHLPSDGILIAYKENDVVADPRLEWLDSNPRFRRFREFRSLVLYECHVSGNVSAPVGHKRTSSQGHKNELSSIGLIATLPSRLAGSTLIISGLCKLLRMSKDSLFFSITSSVMRCTVTEKAGRLWFPHGRTSAGASHHVVERMTSKMSPSSTTSMRSTGTYSLSLRHEAS